MREGTVFLTLQLPKPWPFDAERTFWEQEQGGMRFRITGYPDGHLGFEIESPSRNQPLHHHTQPISVQGSGMMLLNLAWTDSTADVRINGTAIKSLRDETSTHTVLTQELVGKGPLAFEHPEAPAKCQTWIDWRRTQLGIPRLPSADRRLKTDEEQLTELKEEMLSLQDLVEQVRAGKLHLLQKIAGSLRGLVYWQMSKKNTLVASYNPLLLRIAARAESPLPVFGRGDDSGRRPAILDEAQFQLTNNIPTLQAVFPDQTLMDLQEWLSTPISTERFRVAVPISITAMTVKDIIAASANTLGGAHFDEDLPSTLDTLKKLKFEDVDFLTRFFVPVAAVVVQLGGVVARKWHQKTAAGP